MSTTAAPIDLGSNFGPLAMVAGWIFFGLTYSFFGMTAPKNCRKSDFLIWRWKSVCNSLLHSLITGIGSLICFLVTPKLVEDVVDYFAHSTHLLLSFSLGYFTLDFVDMLIHNPRHSQTYELILHHVTVSSCFFISMVFRRYIGYANAALLIELSNVCLHIRQLLHLNGVQKVDKVFRINSFLNVVNFIIFRIVLLMCMTHLLIVNRSRVPTSHYAVGSISLIVIIFISLFIFYRMLVSDFFSAKNSTKRVNGRVSGESVKKST